MSSITVFGGTGYAGSNIVAEAAGRGHTVVAVSRTAPTEPVAGVDYRQGSVEDAAFVAASIADADAVVASLSPRGDMEGRVAPLTQEIAKAAAAAGKRLIVIGGFNGLRAEEGGPRYAASLTDDFPFRAEAQEMTDVVEWLQADAPEGLDWTFVSPPAMFGAFAPGERTGAYRVGGVDLRRGLRDGDRRRDRARRARRRQAHRSRLLSSGVERRDPFLEDRLEVLSLVE